MADTRIHLVKELEARLPRGNTSITSDLLQIIAKAKAGYYHDFESPVATPKMELVKDLRDVGFTDIASRVINGDYDE